MAIKMKAFKTYSGANSFAQTKHRNGYYADISTSRGGYEVRYGTTRIAGLKGQVGSKGKNKK